jgi:hypothetical protein
MKAQSESTKSTNQFLKFFALSLSISILSTSGAMAVDVFQHKDKANLAGWAYIRVVGK